MCAKDDTNIYVFQSTLPHGERLFWNKIFLALHLFQSTLPHGERLPPYKVVHIWEHFNPRSHTGSDNFLTWFSKPRWDFNPRSHTGSDGIWSRKWFRTFISIHAPTRGATAILYKNFAYFHSYVTIINIHCISMHPFADA